MLFLQPEFTTKFVKYVFSHSKNCFNVVYRIKSICYTPLKSQHEIDSHNFQLSRKYARGQQIEFVKIRILSFYSIYSYLRNIWIIISFLLSHNYSAPLYFWPWNIQHIFFPTFDYFILKLLNHPKFKWLSNVAVSIDLLP